MTTALIGLALAGCNQSYRPQMTTIHDSLQQAMKESPVPTTVVIPEVAQPAPGSLWQPGSKQFFKDSRAHKVGDIVTVVVSESSEAASEATTEVDRSHDTNADIANLGNLEGALEARHLINPAGAATLASNLINTDSARTFAGEGKTDRKDNLTASIAAVVTQILPNGYMIIQGKREVMVNYEMQELQIRGIIRPEDISSGNTIASSKIAEARIFYAGKGLVDESQTPQYGVRFMDKVLPF